MRYEKKYFPIFYFYVPGRPPENVPFGAGFDTLDEAFDFGMKHRLKFPDGEGSLGEYTHWCSFTGSVIEQYISNDWPWPQSPPWPRL
jgi:hypothetical protein